MIEIGPNRCGEFVPWAERCSSNQVYPLSIAEGRQSGAVFADRARDPESVLFWHCCGFAYLSGAVTGSLLEEIASGVCRRSKRRMVLITDDAFAAEWLKQKGYAVAGRIEYDYAGGMPGADHAGADLRRIEEKYLPLLTGRIVPRFSWEERQFLKNGFGYVAMDGEKYCGVAFSSAVSSYEVDIGVEVRPDARGRGIATALVRRMCADILTQGKKPVWAHGEQNLASMRTAEKCGFVRKKINRYSVIKQEG